ncbi:MAG: hypothetical protein Harvfovirus40_3 [Harvfovirus sp.]|uniref:Uncharacterized protein n=1 Tax=Harvfovirus sp. TaxID=2487768 RepID=A0A3G5A326_9VIRU|nr:MAG: hypothetical protein Harvfovirus40_3 [Harvfovirus sp.]
MIFCEYRDILGAVGTGFHSFRLAGVAAADVLGVFIIALVYYYFGKESFGVYFARVFTLGQLLHFLFCVETAFLVDYPIWVSLPVLCLTVYHSKFSLSFLKNLSL